jgi:hypothetical protein
MAHNLLFFDMSSRKVHWLLPDNDQIIQSFSFLMDPPGPRYADDGEARKRNQVTIAILLELQRPHATADAGGQTRSLAIASADGRSVTSLTESIGGLLGYHQPSTESAFIFYVSEGATRVLDVDPTTRKVRSDVLLSAQQ